MRVAFMGTPAFAAATLAAVLDAGHDVAGAWTRAPKAAGRGQRERPSAVHALAAARGVAVHAPRTLRDDAAVAALAASGAEVAVVVAYGLILPPAVLALHPCLNVHASLLPRWRGAAPIHRAVMAGDRETGVCVMRMDEGLDTGPVLLSAATPIGAEETTGDLHDRLAAMGAALMVEALARWPLPEHPQPEDGATYAAKVAKEEGRVDWARPAQEVAALVNGLSPAPGAFTKDRLKLLRARVAEGAGEPGAVLAGPGLRVACGAGAVEVLELQRPGARAMRAEEALRGWAPPARL